MPALSALLPRLRASYRRLRYGAAAALGAGAVVLLVGLESLPSAGPRVLLLFGLFVYLGRKLHQFVWIRRAISQLRLEEQFTTLPFDAHLLHRCLRSEEHLWTRSYTFEGFRQLLRRASPEQLKAEQPREKVQRLYHRLLQPLRPTWASLDLSLTLLLAWLGAPVLGLPDALFWSGLAAAPLLLLIEGLLFFEQRDLGQRLAALEETLSTWVLDALLECALQQRSYSHRRLYQAQPWFSTVSDSGT